VDILMKPDPLAEIQTAALLPPIHREMWNTYGVPVPDYDALRYEFVVQKGFTDNGLRDFLREYGETIAFAKLTSSATFAREGPSGEPEELDEDQDEQTGNNDPDPNRKRLRTNRGEGKVKTYALPV